MAPVLLVLAALASTADAASIFDVFGSSVSSLVTTQEEVPYTLIRKAQGYEERKYPAQKWVCKQHSGPLTAEAQQEAFLSLFDYLAGHNNHSLTLDMAIPASVEAPGSPDGRVFEACFYPGRAQQKDIPVPTIGDLYITLRPEMTLFTRRFGGYADTEEEWRTETNSLTKVLQKAGETTTSDKYFWNAYDSPIKFWSRRNEVWILKKE